jgi:hypothetical protein
VNYYTVTFGRPWVCAGHGHASLSFTMRYMSTAEYTVKSIRRFARAMSMAAGKPGLPSTSTCASTSACA